MMAENSPRCTKEKPARNDVFLPSPKRRPPIKPVRILPTMAQRTRMIIIGTVNSDFQIVTDNNQVYEIGDNEKGDELAKLVDKKVSAMGIVEEADGEKVLLVISYEVIEEKI